MGGRLRSAAAVRKGGPGVMRGCAGSCCGLCLHVLQTQAASRVQAPADALSLSPYTAAHKGGARARSVPSCKQPGSPLRPPPPQACTHPAVHRHRPRHGRHRPRCLRCCPPPIPASSLSVGSSWHKQGLAESALNSRWASGSLAGKCFDPWRVWHPPGAGRMWAASLQPHQNDGSWLWLSHMVVPFTTWRSAGCRPCLLAPTQHGKGKLSQQGAWPSGWSYTASSNAG
jgi:hypothetical protein